MRAIMKPNFTQKHPIPLRVIIESPYAAFTPELIDRNIEYAKAAMIDSLKRGEAPFVPHLLYTQVLIDSNPTQRETVITRGHAWLKVANLVAVYCDFGISTGMKQGIEEATNVGTPVELRRIIK